MISKLKVIASYIRTKIALEMSKHTFPKKEDAFTYKEIADSMWGDAWKKSEDHFNTFFDWENNDSTGQKRVITFTDNSDKDISFNYKFNCDLWSAGGDWKFSNYYFKCQIVDGSTSTYDDDKLPFPGPIGQHRNAHFILIPPADEGNTHLQKIKGKWISYQNSDTNPKDIPELEPKKAWRWLENYLKEYIDAYFKNKEKHSK